ncbi:MAG: nitroreductase family protein [Methylophilaceae bacterium]
MNKKLSEVNVCEAILARRSIRAYTQQKVDAKSIKSLIEAAVRAPSVMQLEPWAFAIIQDKKMLKRISDIAKPKLAKKLKQQPLFNATLNQPNFNLFYDANTLIVICANTANPYAVADCWMAAQNLMLAAHAIGLGSCVIAQALPVLNDSEMKSKLGISERFEAIAPIVIGYSNVESLISRRERPLIVNWV